MDRNYTYDAFISYRHADLDKFTAENLHRQLESFRLPASVSKKRSKDMKTRIHRIFRDKDELPIASDLASPIMAALQESEFLIVICSPRTPESVWVAREIDTFISMHGREHILAVLIEGEPSESFPPALLAAEKQVTLPDGTQTIEKVPVEPLAADVRGKNKREVLKNIKSEIIRLAAPMFSCGYDELKQRHRERKIKRTLRIMSAVCIFFLLFGSVSLIQSMQIQKQSKQIQSQSAEIQKQYYDILVTNLYQEADTALRQLKEGDRISSIRTALNALPKDSADVETPFIPHAQYALAKALYVYQNDSTVLADRVLSHDTEIDFMKSSPNGTRILTYDDTNTVHIWDSASGKEISTVYMDDSFCFSDDEDSIAFVSESEFIFAGTDNCLKRYNYETESMVWEIDEASIPYIYHMVLSSDLAYAAVTDYKGISVVDLSDGTITCSYRPETEPDELHDLGEVMTFQKDNSLLAMTTCSTMKAEHGQVAVLNLASCQLTHEISFEKPYINDLLFHEDTLLITASSQFDFTNMTKDDLFGKGKDTDILLYDLSSQAIAWSTLLPNDIIYKAMYAPGGDSYFALKGYSTLYSLSADTGELTGEASLGSHLMQTFLNSENTYALCFTNDGNATSVDLNGGYIYSTFFEMNTTNLKSAFYGDKFYATLPYKSRQVTLYALPTYASNQLLLSGENSWSEIVMNRTSNGLATCSNGTPYTISSYEYPSGKEYFHLETEDIITFLCYGGEKDEYLCCCTNDGIKMYDAKTGEPKKEIEWPVLSSVKCLDFNHNTNMLTVFFYDSCLFFDLNRGEIIKTIEENDLLTAADAFAVSPKDNNLWIVNSETHAIEEYDKNMSKCLRSLTLNTDYIYSMFFSEDGDSLFVTYKNANTEVYQTSDLSLAASYQEFTFIPEKYIAMKDDSGDYLLADSNHAYLCTRTHEIKSYFPNFSALDSADHRILFQDYHELYTSPIYTLDQLREEALKQLK